MSQLVEVVSAWETFSQSTRDELVLGIPQSEVQYDALIAFADELTSAYNCNDPEHAPLFDLVAYYIGEWEKVHEAEILAHEVPPHEMLAYYLDVRGVSQSQLQRDGVVNQGNLSKILKGEREISKALARKLARYFGVSVEVFI
jgi:HTH-type transcriptional regulator/antitoxin HigA